MMWRFQATVAALVLWASFGTPATAQDGCAALQGRLEIWKLILKPGVSDTERENFCQEIKALFDDVGMLVRVTGRLEDDLKDELSALKSTEIKALFDELETLMGVTRQLQIEFDQAKIELISRANALDGRANSLQASINDINGFRNRLNVTTYHVMRGEHHRFAYPNWVTVGCGNLAAWVNAQCAGRVIQQTQVYSRGGDRCGYTYVVATCVQK